MNKAITFIMGCGLVVILRRGDWNELIGHPKDHKKTVRIRSEFSPTWEG
jgi:hypothetical protein